MAAPAFGAAGTVLAGATSGTAAVPVPSGVTSGQIVFVFLYLEANRTVTAPSGFTLLGGANAAASNHWSYVFWKRATASDSGTYSFTFTSTFREAVAIRVTGALDTGDPVDVFSKAARSTSGTVTPAVSVTTTGVDRLLLWFGSDFSTGSWTPPSGFTERVDASSEISAASKVQTAAGASGSITGTSTGNNQQTAWLVAVLPASTDQSVTLAGVASAEVIGSPTLVAGAVGADAGGVASAEAVGTPQLTTSVNVTASGIPSAEAVGTPLLTVGGVLAPDGVPSGEAVGTPTVAPGAASTTPGGVPSAEAVGTPALTLTVTTAGVPSAEAVGTPALTLGPAEVVTAGVPSGEVVPAPAVTAGPISASATGIPSAEVVPAPRVSMSLFVAGIPSQAAVGTPQLTVGAIAILLVGVDSAETVGTPEVTVTLDPTQRIRPVRARVVPLYEVIVVGRVPAQAGPPTFLEVDPIDWSKITWSSTLSRPQTLSVTCKTSTITEPIAQRLRAPDRLPTELWVSRNGRRVFAGPLLGGGRNGDELTLQCGGLLTYLQWMIVAADMRFDQVDQFGIAASLIDQWQALDFGHFGIDTSTVGVSGVLRDRSYVRDEIHQVSRRVEELGAVRDGFDAEVDPTTRKLQLWYPGKGVDRSTGDEAIVFDGTNIDDQNAMFSVAPGDLASDAFGTGSKAGGETSLWSEQSNAELRAAFGRSAVTGSWSDVEEQGTLDGKVGGLLDARDQPLRAPGRKVRVPADADLDAYSEGDIVTYEIDDLLGIGGAYRIRSRTVAVEQTGLESVDLEFV